MSAPGRPKSESPSAQRYVGPPSAPGCSQARVPQRHGEKAVP